MKQYNRLLLGVLAAWLLTSVLAAGLFRFGSDGLQDKSYMVEINRMEDLIRKQGEYREVSLSAYRRVKQVDYLADATGDTDWAKNLEDFFEGKGAEMLGIPQVQTGLEYLVKPYHKDGSLEGYIRFAYQPQKTGTGLALLPAELIILVSYLVIIGILFYIRQNILKPFHEISEFPYELSKGHLVKGLKESKNRYFGKFLWGLELLREHLEELRSKELQLEKDKKLMLLSISHDIKTPLSTIKLYSKAIYENLYKTEEKRYSTAKLIEEKADQIEHYVAEIIQMSSTELFDFTIEVEDFYLSKLIEAIRRTYEEKLELLKIQFNILPFQDKLLMGDMEKLVDVFDNLLQNAIKYGDGRSITISFEEEDNCQLIRVTNSGAPIPATDFIHMFESFWRGANASGKQGNGLGLYICKQLLLKMGGDIYAQARYAPPLRNSQFGDAQEGHVTSGKSKLESTCSWYDQEEMSLIVVLRKS